MVDSTDLGESPSLGAWCILTRRYGQDVRDPSVDEISRAVDELYNERPQDAEHASAALRLGLDDGTMFVIEAQKDTTVTFSKFADQDFEDLLYEKVMHDVPENTLKGVWKALASRSPRNVTREFPACDW